MLARLASNPELKPILDRGVAVAVNGTIYRGAFLAQIPDGARFTSCRRWWAGESGWLPASARANSNIPTTNLPHAARCRGMRRRPALTITPVPTGHTRFP